MLPKILNVLLAVYFFCNCVTCQSLDPCFNVTNIGPHLYTRELILDNGPKEMIEATFDYEGNLFFIGLEWTTNQDDLDDETTSIKQVFVLRKGAKTKELVETVNYAKPLATTTDQTGRVLVATELGLYTYDSSIDKIVPYKLASVYLRDIYAAPDNTLFALQGLLSEHAVTTIRGDKLTPYRNLKSSYNIYIDHDYTLFIDDNDSTFYVKIDNPKIIYVIPEFHLNPAYDMAVDSKNNVFAVNNEGLWISYAGSYEFNHLDVLVGGAYTVAIDQEDTFIVGTKDGVIQFSRADYCWNQVTE